MDGGALQVADIKYIWSKDELNDEDLGSYESLVSFVERLPRVQRLVKGNWVNEPGLINVKELLGSADPLGYLGSALCSAYFAFLGLSSAY